MSETIKVKVDVEVSDDFDRQDAEDLSMWVDSALDIAPEDHKPNTVELIGFVSVES